MNHRSILLLTLTPFAICAAALGACAPDSGITRQPTAASGSGNGSGGAGGELVLVGGNGIGSGGSDAGLDPDAACAALKQQGKATPLSLFIAFDRSSSMTTSDKWGNAKAGLTAFVNDPASTDTAVALNFFPGANESTCDQFAYKTPVVPFGLLPSNAQPIIDALAAAQPTGFTTPIYPALGGALLECNDRRIQNPGTSCAVLLVTDGQPSGPAPLCGGKNPEDPAAIAELASNGVNTFKVLTFVIGLDGAPKFTADQIAMAGGTDAAIMVGKVNVQQEFQNALAKARGKALPCEYELPEKVANGEIDIGFVNVVFTPSGGGAASTILQNPDCSGGSGWFYDNPSMPTKISLCPSTCSSVRTDFGATIDILMGCATEVVK